MIWSVRRTLMGAPGYALLAKYWDTPEEDAAWAYLQKET